MFSALPPALPALARRFSTGPITPLTARLRWWPGFGQRVVARWQLLPGEAVTPRLGTSPTPVAVTKFFGLRLDRLPLQGNVCSTRAGVGWGSASLLSLDLGRSSGCWMWGTTRVVVLWPRGTPNPALVLE